MDVVSVECEILQQCLADFPFSRQGTVILHKISEKETQFICVHLLASYHCASQVEYGHGGCSDGQMCGFVVSQPEYGHGSGSDCRICGCVVSASMNKMMKERRSRNPVVGDVGDILLARVSASGAPTHVLYNPPPSPQPHLFPPSPAPPSIYLPFSGSFHPHPHPTLKSFLSQSECSLLIPQLYPVHRVMYVHNTVHIITLKDIHRKSLVHHCHKY